MALERNFAPNALSVAAQVIALASASVVEDRLTAERVTNGGQPRGDLGDGGVPIDLLEGAVRSLAQGMEDPLATAVLVVVEAERLLARISLGRRVGLVPADLLEVAAIVAAEPDQDAAVALTEDARGRLPFDRAVGPRIGSHLDVSLARCSAPNRAQPLAPWWGMV